MLAMFAQYLKCNFESGVTLKVFIRFKDILSAHQIFIPLAKAFIFVDLFAILLRTFQSVYFQKACDNSNIFLLSFLLVGIR